MENSIVKRKNVYDVFNSLKISEQNLSNYLDKNEVRGKLNLTGYRK